ncbi:Alpha/beta hydrolase family-domain-containing protein [Lipomyces japonicus]|uniref:Alpha/beta hydrolase family-domain-containing protein n=1 Tax=Lipomyces japonicus TaxID=56871 RepID=UPI0034CF7A8A
MTSLTYITDGVKAAYPRSKRFSTVNINDRLDLVVNRYKPKNINAHGFTLVLLHCTGGQKESWEGVINYLFNYSPSLPIREAVAFDWVNHGDSAVVNEDKLGYQANWTDGSRDLLAVVAELQLPEPIIAIGHSMGAGQALFAAHIMPRLFYGVIAVETVAVPFSEKARVTTIAAQLAKLPDEFSTRQEAVQMLNAVKTKRFNKSIVNRVIDASIYEKGGRFFYKTTTVQETATYASASASLKEIFAALASVYEPVLLIVGEKANWNEPTAIGKIQQQLPDSVTVTIPNAGHMLIQEKPDETAAAMVRYLLERWQTWQMETADETRNLVQQGRARLLASVSSGATKTKSSKL